MMDVRRVRGISIDLDDTLWPIWPTIQHAERELHQWMCANAPMTAAMFSNPQSMHELRARVLTARPELRHDLSALRRESIRLAMYRAGDDPLQAEQAFAVFFAARQKVELFSDALEGLRRIAARYPVVSLSNGNADISRIGLSEYFRASLSARSLGVSKPSSTAFEAAAAALELPCDAVLHIGDDMQMDVLGALEVGMQAAWVCRDAEEQTPQRRSITRVKDLLELCELLEV